jgi:hypothetical protein
MVMSVRNVRDVEMVEPVSSTQNPEPEIAPLGF